MAGGMDLGTSSKGGKKSLDAALNMVPFIDLMAVTIAFFIQAGTWTQLGALQVTQAGQDSSAPTSDTPPPMPVNLLVTGNELRLSVGGTTVGTMPVVRNKKGALELHPLQVALAQLKDDRPSEGTITVEAEDAVAYEDLVRIIDQCNGSKFHNVAVMPAAVPN